MSFKKVALYIVILAVGICAGVLIDKANKVLADNMFWSGAVSGTVVTADSVTKSVTAVQVAPDSIDQAYYPIGQTFNLKDMQVGETTSVNLYVRNYTKKIVNVYPLVTATPNINVAIPMSNAKIYPNGWAQFVFQIKALAVGPCNISIGFKSE